MDHTVLQPVGAEINGVSIEDVDTAELTTLLAEHGVLVLPGQNVDDAAFVGFLKRFGELTFTVGETPVPDFDDLNVISNVGRTTPPKSTFHTDTSYIARPPAFTALRAVTIPDRGGATQFTNQYRAFDTLPADVRAELDGRTIRHVVTGLDLGDDAETEAEHPVFRRHPVSGRTTLYLSTPARCVSISGMSDAASQEMVRYLFEHSTREDNVLRHAWSPGDVVIWDNACVLHRADHDGVVGDRVMHRGMVAGPATVAA
ncbi:MAG: TauD/TfdA family dioxygenase [Pseudonocardia sediminis]